MEQRFWRCVIHSLTLTQKIPHAQLPVTGNIDLTHSLSIQNTTIENIHILFLGNEQ